MLYARLALVVAASLVVAIIIQACAVKEKSEGLEREVTIENPFGDK